MTILKSIMPVWREAVTHELPPMPKIARVDRPLSPQAERAIADQVHAMEDLTARCERAEAENIKLKENGVKVLAMNDALKDEIANLKSRATMYQIERDGAVSETAECKGRAAAAVKFLIAAIETLQGDKPSTVALDAEAPNYSESLPKPPTHEQMSALIKKFPTNA